MAVAATILQRLFVEIDNPDQRIAEDVRTFTSFSLSLLITCLTSVIDLVAFSTILWSIYPQLFVAIIVYAGAGTLITALLGRPLVHLNFAQLRAEANLRYALVRLRDNAESIAFYAGEDLEGRVVERRVIGDGGQSAPDQRRAAEFGILYQRLPVPRADSARGRGGAAVFCRQDRTRRDQSVGGRLQPHFVGSVHHCQPI